MTNLDSMLKSPKNGCFWTVVLEKTLECPLDSQEIQPVHPKEISSEYSLEGLMLKLKLQYFGHLMQKLTHWKRPWYWESLKAGEGDGRGWDGWMASPTQWTWVWVNSGSWWWTGRPGMLQSMGSQRVGHDWATELNWQPCCEQIYWQHFPAAFAHFLSLCHILSTLTRFQAFSSLLLVY